MIMEQAMSRAGRVMMSVISRVQQKLSPAGPAVPKKLSQREQLERFMRMTGPEFELLREKHGDDSFNLYVNRMRRLAQEGA